MPRDLINEVELFWELSGKGGDPLVLVHGSWGDHHGWDFIVPLLEDSFRVLTYDRRGHSQSERPAGQRSIRDDVSDLRALIDYLELAPAHILGNSMGGSIVLRLATKHPDLFRSMLIHEPPLFGLAENPDTDRPIVDGFERIEAVVEMLESGQWESGTRLFMETVAFGPGAWDEFSEENREVVLFNAPTFLDEMHDPEWSTIDMTGLANFSSPTLFTQGDQSQPFYSLIIDKLQQAFPGAQRQIIQGSDHVPHFTHPEEYVDLIQAFVGQSASNDL